MAMTSRAVSTAALSAIIAQATAADTGHLPAVPDRTLIRYAELCSSTSGLDRSGIVDAFRASDFAPTDTIRRDLEAFFEAREASYRARGKTNEGMFQGAESHVDIPFGTQPIFFDGPEDWVALVRADTHLAVMNDVPVGNGHSCTFFGYGWTEETQAEAALATLAGEDFIGRGRTGPGDGWTYFFSGRQRGPKPIFQFGVWAVKGAPGAIPPTVYLEWTIVNDMTIPPWVFSTQ